MKLHEKFFIYLIYLSYFLYFIALFGISGYAPEYLNHLKGFLKLYIGLLLVYLYNPITYKKREFKNIDREIVFSSAIFLLLSTTLISGFEEYIKSKSKELINIGFKVLD